MLRANQQQQNEGAIPSVLNKPKENRAGLLTIVLIGIALPLAACGEKPQAPPPQAMPSKLYQQERETLEKAKGVEQTEANRAENLKQETEKQSQ